MRAFIAIDIERQELKAKLIDIMKKIENSKAMLKMVEPDNLHITIKFLGEISEKDIPLIQQVILSNCKSFNPFEISLEGLSAFPSVSNPRVIWVGVSLNRDTLSSLATRISNELEKMGFRKETRPFHPHITIARVKRPNPQLKKMIRSYHSEIFGKMMVDKIRLKKSTLTPQGPIYTTIFEIPLGK